MEGSLLYVKSRFNCVDLCITNIFDLKYSINSTNFFIQRMIKIKVQDGCSLAKQSQNQSFDKSKISDQSQVKLSEIQQIKEDFMVSKHYCDFLVSENRDRIQRVIGYTEIYGQNYSGLGRALRTILLNSNERYSMRPDPNYKCFIAMTKEIMQNEFINLEKDKLRFYQSVLNQSIITSSKQAQELKIIEANLTLKMLFQLDVLSVFCHQNLIYFKVCGVQTRLMARQDLKELFDFSPTEISKLVKESKHVVQYLKFDVSPIFRDLAACYHIIKLRNRAINVVSSSRKIRIAVLLSQDYTIDYSQVYEQASFENNSEPKDYCFCQLPFISYEREIQNIHIKTKREIVREIAKANLNQQKQSLKKALLWIKIKFGLKFNSLYKFQTLISEHRYSEVIFDCDFRNRQKKAEIQKQIRFAFVNNDSFYTVFIKNLKYNVKYGDLNFQSFDQITSTNCQAITLFMNIAWHRRNYYATALSRMLKFEEDHNSQFIVIKKMMISYNNLKRIEYKSARQAYQEDLFFNVILITNRRQIKTFCFVKGAMKDQAFFKILKRVVRQLHKSSKFIVLLKDNQIGSIMSLKQYYRFYWFVIKQLESRLYMTCMNRYSELNELIIAYLKAKLSIIASTITKQSFYEKVEAELENLFQKLLNKF